MEMLFNDITSRYMFLKHEVPCPDKADSVRWNMHALRFNFNGRDHHDASSRFPL